MHTIQEGLNVLAGTTGLTSQDALNRLAGLPGGNLDRGLAWNRYAGTTGLSAQEAANVKNGTTNKTIQECVENLAYGFNPASVADLELYYTAMNETYNVGTTLATDGQTVATWGDQSTSNNDAVQGTEARKPIYRATGGPNSKPCLEFDGTDDVLIMGTNIVNHQKTVFIVMSKTAVGAGYDTIVRLDRVQMLARMGTAGDVWGAWENAEVTSSVQMNTTFGVYAMCQTAFDNVDLVTNGVLSNQTNGTALPAAAPASSLGDISTGTQATPAKVSALLVYNRILTTTERSYVERGLGSIWGITVA